MNDNLMKLRDLMGATSLDEKKYEKILNQIEKNLKPKKNGLVWAEDESETVSLQLKTHYPILRSLKTRTISTHKEDIRHKLIEGDNLHALEALQSTHQSKIDIIYIDPPYNTGNGDFIYNGKTIDDTNTWRHSLWLSFMSKRLKLAKKLMNKDGLIFISIDDNEFSQLKMLCDEIFGSNCFLGNIVQVKGNAQNDAVSIQKNHEYILVYKEASSQISDIGDNVVNYSTRGGTDALKSIFGTKSFDNPKNPEMIKHLLRLHPNKDAIVLDFFAGSGTTGQAVLELNKEDEGKRQFILSTDNYNNICRNVTHKRLDKVVRGYKNSKKKTIEGLGGNLDFYKISLQKKTGQQLI